MMIRAMDTSVSLDGTSPRPRIAFFSDRPPERMEPYMRGDYEILCELGSVTWASSVVGPGWRRVLGPTGWLPSRSMLKLVRSSDLVFQWFASPAAPIVAARLCRRPAIVVAGGYDVAAVPEIHYGQMLGWRTRSMGKLALRLATQVLCVSQSTLAEVHRWVPEARAMLVYHGFNPDGCHQGCAKRGQVLTVGAISAEYLERKGMIVFAEASRLLPAIPFVLAGRIVDPAARERLQAAGGSNLRFAGCLAEEDLRALMGESAVYAQLSLHEAFGCALAEAMLCECTPVVTPCAALPEVAGSCGFVVPPRNPAAAAQAITRALREPRGVQARRRVLEQFPAERRKKNLTEAVLTALSRVMASEGSP